MVLAPDNVADAKIDVVGTRCEVVGGHAVGAQKCEVFYVIRRFDLLAVDRVIEAHLLAYAPRYTKAKREGFSGCSSAIAFCAREFAHAGVEKPGLVSSRFLTVAAVGWSEVAVSVALLK